MTYGIAYDEFTKYLEDMEESILEGKKSIENEFKKRSQGLEEEEKNELFEYNYLDDYQSLNSTFPDMLRRSLVIACYSFLEKQMKNLCDVLNRRYSYPPISLKNFYIFDAEKYLRDNIGVNIVFDSPFWEEIRGINKVRNYIVHESTDIIESDHKAFKVIMDNTLIVKEHKMTRTHSKIDIYKIEFTKEYIEHVIKTIVEFLNNLCREIENTK